ncbi:MAG: hypothetical protein NZ749_12560 [bacterium]|nr:hypothetical protein [bacterium]
MRPGLVAASALAVCLITAPAAAQLNASLTYTLSSKYVSRGVNTVNHWVLQKDTSFQFGNFTASLWGNMELTNHNGSQYVRSKPAGTFTEWNFTIEYATSWKSLQVALGWIDYQYPGTGWERTREAYLSLGADHPLSPNITVYRDTGVARGLYITAGVEMPVRESLSLSAQVGYGCPRFNGYYYSCEAASWVDLTLGLSTALDIGRGWQIKPTLWYSTLLDRRLLADQPNRRNIWFSVEIRR